MSELCKQFEITSYIDGQGDYNEAEANAEDLRTPHPSAYAVRALIDAHEMEREFQTGSLVCMRVMRRTYPNGASDYYEQVCVTEALPDGNSVAVILHERRIHPNDPPQYASLIQLDRRAIRRAKSPRADLKRVAR